MSLTVKHIWNVRSEEKDVIPWVNRLRLHPMKDFMPLWYKNLPRETDASAFTLKMCPSTTNFMNNGFVVTNPADLFVQRVSEDEVVLNAEIDDNRHIVPHDVKQFGESYPFEDGFIKQSFKFESFWELSLSRAATIMFLPCWWSPDYNLVRAYHGMVHVPPERSPTSYLINTKLRLPPVGGSYTLKAEAPIAHLLFVDVLETDIGDDLEDFSELKGRNDHALHKTAMFSRGYFKYLKSFLLGDKND